ncbi:SBBP repeat-containing protein [Clostridium sp. ZS2-4]|uniref:SBBP repeat-containing protein n=1 Tax=Clostridium sp. ZS2-4 TaxID=2987703 RepID=UPI00227A25B1|nr:SBBP repeat-containing protein [Clostridium sp. ZS2-4]MCY6354152.1 SBBP repeat-containing protein [Clostridium sp. ZS2-4]
MTIKIKKKNYTKDDNSIGKISEEKKNQVYEILKSIPSTFIYNEGQVDSKVKYYIKGSSCGIYFTQEEVVLTFLHGKSQKDKMNSEEMICTAFHLQFAGANSDVRIEGENKCKGTVNYFKGNDSSKWHTQIATYEKIIYKELWSGVDLVFYGMNGELKYDFILQPGASVEDIGFIYKGCDEIDIDEKGNLIIGNKFGVIIDEKPISYQQIDNKKIMVESNFVLKKKENNKSVYGFKISDNYNPDYSVIIDPQILYSSYLGGSGDDYGYGIAVDNAGNVYVTGRTYSSDFPTDNGFDTMLKGSTDAFVTKIDGIPSIVYSSYLGGSGSDYGYRIAVDNGGNVYVTGATYSLDFPTDNGFDTHYNGNGDVFVTKIDSVPSIVYSSYLGGSGVDWGNSIVVDNVGNVYVTGYTSSVDFPTDNGFDTNLSGNGDVFVTKIDVTPSIVYSSYLGGSSWDYGWGIAVDNEGNVYVTGHTYSTDFPTDNGFDTTLKGSRDVFVTKIDSTPSIVYSSYLGGSSSDYGYGIAVDNEGNVYVTGFTYSSDFPTNNGFDTNLSGSVDAFVTKIDGTPSIVYSSYLGGSDRDYGRGIAVDNGGNVYVTGYTESSDFPIDNGFGTTLKGSVDAFVTKIDSTPSIVYSSYLGGSSSDEGWGIAVDDAGNVYVTGETSSKDFTIYNAFDTDSSRDEVFVTKIGEGIIEINNVTITGMVVNGTLIK